MVLLSLPLVMGDQVVLVIGLNHSGHYVLLLEALHHRKTLR